MTSCSCYCVMIFFQLGLLILWNDYKQVPPLSSKGKFFDSPFVLCIALRTPQIPFSVSFNTLFHTEAMTHRCESSQLVICSLDRRFWSRPGYYMCLTQLSLGMEGETWDTLCGLRTRKPHWL